MREFPDQSDGGVNDHETGVAHKAFGRRELLRGVAAGAGLLALGVTADALGQIDDTPPVEPGFVPVTAGGETVADRAFALGNDLDRIFAFVTTEIRYEAYDGSLRGAQGALWARAANSVDQAALLLELLTVSQIPCRFAFGTLTAEGEQRLAEVAMPSESTVRDTYAAALAGSLGAGTVPAATPAPLTPDQQEMVDQVLDQAAQLQDRAATLTDALSPLIAGVLDRAGVTLPELPSPLTDMERFRHTWVQVADGPTWIDLDPVATGAEPGTTLAALETTAIALPDDLQHRVRVALVAEEATGGSLSRREVLAFESPSFALLNTPIALTMTSRDDLGDVGLAITDLFQGSVSLVPCLVAGDTIVTATTPMVFGSEGGGALGALDATTDTGPVDGETLAVFLVAEVTSPSGETQTVERALIDRVGFSARSAGAVDLSAVMPATLVTDAQGVTTVAELAGLTIIDVSLARLPSIYATRDARSAELLGNLYLFGSSFNALRTSVGFEHEGIAGFQSYPAGPSLCSFSVRFADPADDGAGIDVTSDLLMQSRALVPLADSDGASTASPHILAGVLDQVAEQVLVEPLTATGDDAVNVVAPTVGGVFLEAQRAGIGIAAIATPDALAALPHSRDALARMQHALDQGLVVVVPEAPVTVNGEDALGWWLVDPVTGQVRDEMANGQGYAGGVHALQAAPGYGRLLNNLRTWAAPYAALARCLAIVAAAAVRASDYSGTSGPSDAVVETLKNVNPGDVKGCTG